MDFGTFLLMLAFSYGLGVFWYDLLPGKLATPAWRVAAYPFAAMVIGLALFPLGPAFGGVYIIPAIVATLVGTIIDWIITSQRHPSAVHTLETPGFPVRP